MEFLTQYILSEEKVQVRRSICETCEYWNSTTELCKKCGCYMPWKWQLAPATCPEHRWMSETGNMTK
jgi:hypothetical protein